MRRFLLGIVGLVVLGGLVAIGFWWIDHDPLVITEVTPPPGSREVREPEGAVIRAPYRDAEVTEYSFTVRNAESVTVEVRAIDEGRRYGYALLKPVGFGLGAYDPDIAIVHDHVIPFEPFTLAEDEVATITVYARFQDCEFFHAGERSTIRGHALRIGFGPLPKTLRLPLPTPLSIVGPGPAGTLGATGDCPRERPPEGIRAAPNRPGFRPEDIRFP